MPTTTRAALRLLRTKYQIAYDANQSCVRAVSEARVRGASPSAELLERAAKARQDLADARRAFMSGIG
jgi:hypothetical protein